MKLALLSLLVTLLATVLVQGRDNNKVEARAGMDTIVSAYERSTTDADLAMTRKIQQELTLAKNLTKSGKSVNVVTEGGVVKLRGPVRSSEEKQTICAIVERASGGAVIENRLKLSPSR